MRLTKTSVFGEIVALAARQIRLAAGEGIQSTITTNKAGRKFFNLFGNTFPIKDQLGRKGLGFNYFQGTWGLPIEKALEIEAQIQALGIDTSPLHSQQATAPTAPQAAPVAPVPAAPAQANTPTDQTLAEMKAAIDAELKQGPATSEKAKRMLEFIDKMIDKVAGSVDEAAKQDFVKNFLAFASKFHNYSFGNQMLIWIQKPDSTYVAGHAQWMKKGRQVVNWGNPISIIRPQTNRKTLSDEELKTYNISPDQRERSWTSFKPATVYDITDTQPIAGWKDKEGNGPFEPPKLKTDSNEQLEHITALVKAGVIFSQSLGISVDLEKELHEDTGGYSAGKDIAINKLYQGINQFGTLVHEMAHEILHREDDQRTPVKGESRQSKEIDAETTSYIVLKHYGFEPKDAPNYIALWRATGEDVRKRRNNISKAVQIIIKGIDGKMGSVIESGFQDAVPEEGAPTAPLNESLPASWIRNNCRFAQDMTEETTTESFTSSDPSAMFDETTDLTGDLQLDESMQEFQQGALTIQDSINKMPSQIQTDMTLLWQQFQQAAQQTMQNFVSGNRPGPLATSIEKP